MLYLELMAKNRSNSCYFLILSPISLIKVLADQNLYKLSLLTPQEVELTFYDPQAKFQDLNGFDALLIRTVTKINKPNFPVLPSSLKFVGTGSSGSDHVDIDYLESQEISFFDAKGCNARAVAEYVLTSLLLWSMEKEVNLEKLTFGIVGMGKTGTAVSNLFKKFGLYHHSYDPPREEIDADFTSCSLEELLGCDILTFHVPLTKSGRYPTFHWLHEEILESNQFKLIINASRGGVVKESALMKALDAGIVGDCIIDVWEGEPNFSPGLANRAFLATPHIAGYSEQAKLNASKIIIEQFCQFFGLESPAIDHLYERKNIELAHLSYSLSQLLSRLHPIKEYDAVLRDLTNREDKAALFSKLRTDRPYRFEYPYLNLDNKYLEKYGELGLLGIKPHLRT